MAIAAFKSDISTDEEFLVMPLSFASTSKISLRFANNNPWEPIIKDVLQLVDEKAGQLNKMSLDIEEKQAKE